MALNPPLSRAGIPLKVHSEVFILQRQNMEIEVKIPNGGGKKTGNGIIYLTNCRIVFIHDKYLQHEFKSFDIPLNNLFNEKFEQPVFGSNYLSGSVKPLFNLLPGDSTFKLWFKSGGCGTFLKVIDNLLGSIRKRRNQGDHGPDPRFVQQVINGSNNQALFDPNDPSVIYVSQPQGNNYDPSQNFYGQNFQNPYYPQQQYQQPPMNQQVYNPPQNQQQMFVPYNPDELNQIQMNQPPQQMYQPPQQMNYPPQWMQQPPQQMNYPPQQMNYPPQQMNYPPQQGYYPPQQQINNYPPQQMNNFNYPPNQENGMNNPQYQNYPQQQNQYEFNNQQNQQNQQGKYFGFMGPKLENNQPQ